MCVELKCAKFQPSSASGTFSNWGLKLKGGKFNEKLVISLKW